MLYIVLMLVYWDVVLLLLYVFTVCTSMLYSPYVGILGLSLMILCYSDDVNVI